MGAMEISEKEYEAILSAWGILSPTHMLGDDTPIPAARARDNAFNLLAPIVNRIEQERARGMKARGQD